MAQDKYRRFHAAKTSALQMGFGCILVTIKTTEKRNENFPPKISGGCMDEKKQKQDIIQKWKNI